MSTTSSVSTEAGGTAASPVPASIGDLMARRAARRAPRPIPMHRILAVELRKMFNTRSGFWLMSSIGILAVVATGAAILFAPESELNYEIFASAVGVPMSVILPMVAVLSVTSEWSQRSGLTTFTLIPHRGRVITAKLIATVLVGAAGMVAALAIGAVGNVIGSSLAGVDIVWNVAPMEFARIVLASEIGMLMGFALGVLIRNSPAAIVGYFVCALVLPTVSGILAAYQEWYRDIQAWIDLNFASTALYDVALTGDQWAQLGVASTIWLLIPLTVGLILLMRSEVK